MTYLKKSWLKTVSVLLLFFSFYFSANASNSNPWSPVRERAFATKAMQDARTIIPKKYKTFSLNLSELQVLLSTAPMRFTEAADNQAVVLNLPMPNGVMQRFQIFDAPIMEYELAVKFPMIHSYAGVGLDDPSASLRFDVTPYGFHALVLSARQGSVYIDPYSKADTEHYISYYKSDFEKENNDFMCHVESDTNVDIDADADVNSLLQGDCQLRTYRLALTCTGEYAAFHGGTIAGVLSAMNTTMTRVNGVYEREINVTMVIVANNENLIFLDAATDPYNDGSPGQMIGECHTQCNAIIGSANYDIGHVFSTGGGGLAGLGVVCSSGSKGNGVTGTTNPVGDPYDIDYVAHEMGHQFGANHTFNNSCGGNQNPSTAMEPGSAATIMGYAGICPPNVQFNSDDYFHAISIQEISNNINGGTSSTCPVSTDTGNSAPTVNGGADYTLPISTPFKLAATGSDADGDAITYCWEQMNPETAEMPPVSTSTGGPAFRSFNPTEVPYRYFPKLTDIINGVDDDWEELPSVSRNMNFRVTIRDNHMGSGCTAEDDVSLTFSNTAGPFLVQTPNTNITWTAGTTEMVTWDVANTDAAPVSCANVDILLSTDGGLTYPVTLASGVPNNGAYNITVPSEASTTCRTMVVCSDNIFFDISNTNFTIDVSTTPTFSMSATPTVYDVCGSVGSVDYQLDLTSLVGFDESVTFSITGQPTAAMVSFSQNNVVPTATSTLTLSNLGNVNNGMYNIIVTAASASVTLTQMLTLTVSNSAPSMVNLVAPANGMTEQMIAPNLTWSAMATATNYVVEIATTPAFGNTIVETFTTDNNLYAPQNLMPLTVYFWRVRAVNNCGESNPSGWYAFQTGGSGCLTFNSTDTPIEIPVASSGTVTSSIQVASNVTISEVKVSMNVSHTWIGDLKGTLNAPSGSAAILFDRVGVPASQYGCDGDNLLLTFDDNATNTATDLEGTCGTGAYALEGTYQPVEPLSAFAGQNSSGNWTLDIFDAVAEDGGIVESWGVEICFAGAAGTPPDLVNNALTVAPGTMQTVPDVNLKATAANNTASQITFILMSLPQNGTLQINGMAASIGSTFTQADIDNNLVVYSNTDMAATSDYFTFDITTVTGGWIQSEVFDITIGIVTISATVNISQEINCAGGSDGEITVSATGINPPFEYSLNNMTYQESNVFPNLSAGTYDVNVKDSQGNIFTSVAVLANPTPLDANATSNGTSVTITASGGVAPYIYNINGSSYQDNNVFTNLPNGSYTFGIQDANGCETTVMETVNVILSASASTTSVTCHNGQDGILTVENVEGGTTPYLYSLDNINFVSGNQFTGLASGNYTVYVMDASGFVLNAGTFMIGNAPNLSVTAMTNDNNITATGLGGTGTLQYSINGNDFQASNIFTNIPNGTYNVIVMDENGCLAETDNILIDFTSINELNFDLSFGLFPNPNHGQFTIELNQSTEQKLTLHIFDVTGKLVEDIRLDKNNTYLKSEINVSHLPAGSYEVLLFDGEMFGRKRFVKM